MRRSRLYFAKSTTTTHSWLARIAQATLLLIALLLSLMFSVILIPTVILLGLSIWGFIWWKTRDIRARFKEMSNTAESEATHASKFSDSSEDNSQEIRTENIQRTPTQPSEGVTIDGEARRI